MSGWEIVHLDPLIVDWGWAEDFIHLEVVLATGTLKLVATILAWTDNPVGVYNSNSGSVRHWFSMGYTIEDASQAAVGGISAGGKIFFHAQELIKRQTGITATGSPDDFTVSFYWPEEVVITNPTSGSVDAGFADTVWNRFLWDMFAGDPATSEGSVYSNEILKLLISKIQETTGALKYLSATTWELTQCQIYKSKVEEDDHPPV